MVKMSYHFLFQSIWKAIKPVVFLDILSLIYEHAWHAKFKHVDVLWNVHSLSLTHTGSYSKATVRALLPVFSDAWSSIRLSYGLYFHWLADKGQSSFVFEIHICNYLHICKKHTFCVLILSEVISWIYEMSQQKGEFSESK